MDNNFLIFKGLFDIWKSNNFNLYFYFQEIFNRALESLEQRTAEAGLVIRQDGESRYKALFVPVGFSIENAALITGLLKPDYLKLAFTETTKAFHARHIHIVKENIKRICPDLKISETTTLSDDKKATEAKIVEWLEEMKTGYGLSYSQMAIDLTGGTKPMSIGAHNAALSYDEVDAFYLKADYDLDTQEPVPGSETLMRLQKDKAQVDEDLVFVIMPFKEEFNEIYQKGIKDAVEGMGLMCLRVDEDIFHGGIMDRVRELITKAKIIIAELTDPNPNVYYELGLSHGNTKKVILLTQDIDKLPFDVRHLRMAIYSPSNLSGLQGQLRKEVEYIRSE